VHSAFRFHTYEEFGGARNGIQSFAPLELYQGTVSVLVRMAGISRIEAYLGEFKNVPDMIDKVVPSVFADLGTVVSLFAALTSSSHTKRDLHIRHMVMQTTFFWQWPLPRA
jgi:hypothetical protein